MQALKINTESKLKGVTDLVFEKVPEKFYNTLAFFNTVHFRMVLDLTHFSNRSPERYIQTEIERLYRKMTVYGNGHFSI